MYIASGQGQTAPRGQFWIQQKGLITLPICCKFQRNLFEVWFYKKRKNIYDLLHVYSPGAGAYSAQVTWFWCQQKLLCSNCLSHFNFSSNLWYDVLFGVVKESIKVIIEALRGMVPVPLFPSKKMALFPKNKILIFYVPCSRKLPVFPVPLIFRPLFPCFPEKLALVPLFPKTLGGPHNLGNPHCLRKIL